jgi:very-short-patch-repair endonuclease/predicted transcriptional regulator of viral defense system
VDGVISELAERQHGVVARRQLIDLGVSKGSIQHRIAICRLHPVFRGVYAVGHPRLTQRGRWMAAVLTAGAGALLSHRSGAALWGIASYAGQWIDVTSSGARRARRHALVVHGGLLSAEDHSVRDNIAVTSVARTLLDLAEVVDRQRLARAVEEAERLELFDLKAIDRLLERSRGRRGTKALRLVIADFGPIAITRSELERLFMSLCRESALPLPATNRLVEGFEVDALWEAERLVVELDGFAFHRTSSAFETDRRRDAMLLLAGYRVLRLTHRRLVDEPAAVAAEIRRLLESGPLR